MSTRATIKVVKNGETQYRIYHHCEGFPEGVGKELKEFLSNPDNYDADRLWEQGVNNGLEGDLSYEFESITFMHGDEEFEYTIDTDNKKLLCYDIRREKYIDLY
ncbi:MAG: hypothetical protein SPK91_06095 [Bacteroidales bacterium]|nr:hypothetical protein [Bacteroidales bacterium]